jgi:hypothetical protein
MSMNDLEQAFHLIEDNAGGDFEGPKPDHLIENAEATLGLSFPPTYREFLRRLGAGDIAGAEFYGVIKDDFIHSSVPDAIWLTLDERKNSNLPESLIIVADTGYGHYYAIDVSKKTATEESPIVEWSPGDNSSQVVADDFGAFLLQRLREAVQ